MTSDSKSSAVASAATAVLLLAIPYAGAAFADDPLAGSCTFKSQWSDAACVEFRSPASAPWTAAGMAERCAAE
eukprot:CAMPEP_0194336990 /NCGR_PEP_ID=MMETSP0171-20130528/74788_1 /TAXON_ID=218684 /ORGANISM="Corethron pennatum, Strain L29A3" /LENGTH=72 /DNA_ID=CAMNT_0039100593 /DNA_START=69 /DNA_END=284 /DNA_ORIENTATION=-